MKLNNLDDFTKNNWYTVKTPLTIETVSLKSQQQQSQQQQQQQHQKEQEDIKIEDPELDSSLVCSSDEITEINNSTMPSKQTSDVLAVEELVHEIKENLRLKARPSHSHGRHSRPSPYHIPCRSWNDQHSSSCNENSSCSSSSMNKCLHHNHKTKSADGSTDIDDPYELLQALLKSKNLVKEAVRRLQLNSISPKQRSYFYESDEESSRSPIFRMCQLEL